MAFLRNLSIASVLGATALVSENQISQDTMWTLAHNSDWSIAHKLYLCWEEESLQDKIFKQFYLGYAHYKSGDLQEAFKVYEIVDGIIENEILTRGLKQ